MNAPLKTATPRAKRLWLAGAGAALVLLASWGALRARGIAPPALVSPAVLLSAKGNRDANGAHASSGGSVMLTPEQTREFGVTFGTAEVRQLTAEARTTGVVTFDETRVTQVAARMSGFVERLYVNATGEPVRRGQPLLEIYSPELVATQQELLLARQLERDVGRTAVPGVPGSTGDLVAAARHKLQLLDISGAQVDEIVRTGRTRRTLTLFAPASGVVMEKKVIQGASVAAGALLFTIVDLSGVWVDAQLREGDAASVRVGTGADIAVAGMPGRTLKGRVTFIYPTLDSSSRAVRARISVSNPAGTLKPGMYAAVTLATPGRSVLTVPASAILRTGERDVVFMDVGKGTLMPMEVRIGATASGYTEVLSGVQAGARVVTSAQFLLDSESNLGDAMKGMIGQGSAGRDGSGSGAADMRGMAVPALGAPKR
ncbi:efflux RND transporter periplasmic adaptor subunit [soil metagenome]